MGRDVSADTDQIYAMYVLILGIAGLMRTSFCPFAMVLPRAVDSRELG